MKRTIKLGMMGTKHTEFSEELGMSIMSGIVILGNKKNKVFIVYQNL